MSVQHPERDVQADPAVTATQQDPVRPAAMTPRGVSRTGTRTRTRTGAAWFGICTAAVALVVLVVFMLQNTGSVEVTFLWMHGSVPLALALLVAGVGTAALAMAVGAARVGQLRRLARNNR
jgi:uncharacterized integral membrane protein